MVNGASPYFHVLALQLGATPFTFYRLPFTITQLCCVPAKIRFFFEIYKKKFLPKIKKIAMSFFFCIFAEKFRNEHANL